MISMERVLATALSSRRGMSALRRAVTDDLVVANPFYRDIMTWAAGFVDSHGDIPKDGDAAAWVGTQAESRQEALRSAWRTLRGQDLSDVTPEYLADVAVDELRTVAARNALSRMTAVGDADPEMLSTMAERVERIRPVRLDGLADLRDVDAHLRAIRDDDAGNRIPTGLHGLDEWVGGGFGAELVFLLGATGGGKTTWLVNRGVAAARYGAKVLHVTLELVRDKTMHRYYRRIAEAHRGEFYTDIEAVRGRARHWLRFAEGSVHVLYLPAYGPTVDDLRATVDLFAETHGGVDVVVLDYLDLLARTSDQSRLQGWDQLGRMSHEVRTICTEFGAEVVTAAQATREGLDASDLRMKHMAGSTEKLRAADVVLGLVQDEDEAETDQARVQLLKVRDNPGRGAEIPVYMNLDLMAIMDLDHPDARRIRRELKKEAAR